MTRPEALPTAWALVTVDAAGGSQVGVRAVDDPHAPIHVPDVLRGFDNVFSVVQDWSAYEGALRDYRLGDGELIEGPIATPLRYPRKVLCSGPNFTDHLAEMGESGLGEQWSGYFFFKPPTTTLIGPEDDVLVGASWQADRVDWEGELAVVVADGGRDIAVDTALDHVAGYAVANDISLRGPHRRDTPAAPFVWDWVASKAADSSLPLGPGLVPHWLVPDPGQLRIRTLVNGRVMQDGTTANMVLDVARLIADASRLVTLEPGDVVVTGTPAGVGAGRGEFLQPGDQVTVEIDGIGTLHNHIRLRDDARGRAEGR